MIDIEEIKSLSTVSLHKLIEEARDDNHFATADKEWREYAQGIHRPMADPTQRLLLGEMETRDVQENMIGQCLDQISGRLRFRSFAVDNDKVLTFLNDDFAAKNQLDRAVMALTKRTQTDGNAAMSVSWRGDHTGRPVIHHESWWDGEKGMFVAVSDGGDVLWAVSEWYDRDNNKWRTLYLDDQIIRYRQEGDGWTIAKEIPWVKRDGSPLGVPVAHFPNGASAYGPYAPSTVASVIGNQDQLNAALFNRAAVVAMTGAQIYWATGASADGLEVGPGKLWATTKDSAKFGAIQPGNLDGLITETEDIRSVIAGAFSVPSYRIGRGDWPSGMALQRADAPMIALVRLLGDMEAPGLTMLAHRATEQWNTFSSGDQLDESAIIDVEWEPADEVDPGTKVEIDTATAKLYALVEGLPEVLIRKMDIMTEDELTKFLAEVAARQELVADAQAANPDESKVGGW